MQCSMGYSSGMCRYSLIKVDVCLLLYISLQIYACMETWLHTVVHTKVILKCAVLFEDTMSTYIQGLSSIIIYICMSGIAHDMKCRLQFLVF